MKIWSKYSPDIDEKLSKKLPKIDESVIKIFIKIYQNIIKIFIKNRSKDSPKIDEPEDEWECNKSDHECQTCG